MNARAVKAVVFDAYGTLFDVYSVRALADELYPGAGERLAEIWRVAQIDYTRIRAMSGHYADFWAVTGDALDFAVESLGLPPDPVRRQALLDQYAALAAFPEVPDVTAKLNQDGLQLAILSNGSPAMLAGAVAAAGLEDTFAHVLSADAVKTFMTAPEVYRLAPDALGMTPDQIAFVSSNGWDVCGATWFGFRSFWVNRTGKALDRLGVSPDGTGRTLRDLPAFLIGLP